MQQWEDWDDTYGSIELPVSRCETEDRNTVVFVDSTDDGRWDVSAQTFDGGSDICGARTSVWSGQISVSRNLTEAKTIALKLAAELHEKYHEEPVEI